MPFMKWEEKMGLISCFREGTFRSIINHEMKLTAEGSSRIMNSSGWKEYPEAI